MSAGANRNKVVHKTLHQVVVIWPAWWSGSELESSESDMHLNCCAISPAQ